MNGINFKKINYDNLKKYLKNKKIKQYISIHNSLNTKKQWGKKTIKISLDQPRLI